MKALLLALALTTSSAFAAEILVDSRVARNSRDRVGAQFKFNEELGRAWVELEISDGWPTSESASIPWQERVKVPGLSLQDHTVVLDVDGQLIECAYIRNVGIFRTRAARNTGHCVFELRKSSQTLDDGFETRQVTILNTYLLTY